MKNKKYKLIVQYDEFCESPREWDNLGKLICWHGDYSLGDEHNFKRPVDFLGDLASKVDNEKAEKIEEKEYEGVIGEGEACSKYLKIIDKNYIIFPVYLLDHSILKLSIEDFNCKWDSGQVGFVYIPLKEAIGNNKKEKMEYCKKVINGELEIYNYYLNGEVYSFIVGVYNEDDELIEEYDSCGGFYGYNIYENGMIDYIPEELNIELSSDFAPDYMI